MHHTLADSSEWPERIAALERDARGYPVPFIVLRDHDGLPQFTANDMRLVKQAIDEGLCHICGQTLDQAVWFTGGAGSALLNGDLAVYADGPMHHECMRFAMQVCPHLAHRMTAKALAPTVAVQLADKGILIADGTTIPGTPALFVSVQTLRWRFKVRWLAAAIPHPEFILPKPVRKTEYWQSGELMPLYEGQKAAKRAARELAQKLRATRQNL